MERNDRKIIEGMVLSNRMDKTVVVRVERKFTHSFYHKIMRRSSKFKAHDPENKCQIGDLVKIMETRPLSKGKRFRVIEIAGKGKLKLSDLPKMTKKEAENIRKCEAQKEEEKSLDPSRK